MLRRSRSRQPVTTSAYLPPPEGHRAVVAAGERTMTCPCGWCYALPWPLTSGRLNRARGQHYSAVAQEHVARRLGVDVESMLDRVVQAREVPAPLTPPVALRRVEAAAPAKALTQGPTRLRAAAVTEGWPSQQPTRDRWRAAQARRASAIARVEAGRVLPHYTGNDE